MNKTITNLKAVFMVLSLVFIMMAAGTKNSIAQTNIAPLATASAQSNNGLPPSNWNRINDGVITTCNVGQECFTWSAGPPNGTEHMQWDWNQDYLMDSIIIYHNQTFSRFLTGGTIQYWDGASWINHFTFSGLPVQCVNSIKFPLISTSRLRIANYEMTAPGQNSNPNFKEIEIYEGKLPGTNGRTIATINVGENCGGTSDSISIEVQNIGTVTIKDFYVGTRITGTLNGSPVSLVDSVLITDSILSGDKYTKNLLNINSIDGGTLDIVSWFSHPQDTNKMDDTAKNNVKILGSPTTDPTPANADRCGTGTISLTATAATGNTVYWYDAPTGGNLVGKGTTFTTPVIAGGVSRTYYAAGVKESGDSTHSLGFAGTNFAGAGFNGGNMFNVNIKKPITIDSLHVHLNLTNQQEVVIYMKQGPFGNAITNAAAWTLVDRATVQARGAGNASSFILNKPFYIEPGSYAFYIFADENLIFETITTGRTVNNDAISTTHGIALRDTFGVQFGGQWSFNGDFFYHESCIKGNRLAAVADAKPLPVGSNVKQGSTFQGAFVGGTSNQPDIVANPDKLIYELDPPTGFNNADFGTTWSIPAITVTTPSGAAVPTADYTVTNPGGSNGEFEFNPSSSLTDSLIKVSIVLRRLDNGCDSLVERYIFVAPRPQVSFTTNSACKGDAIEFKNSSTITSGTISYDWDFADGNGSDLANPFHAYNVAGTYNAKLIVTSNYGYQDSITVPVQVFEVPTPDFDFTNACEGTAIQLADASTLPAGAPTFIWNFGDGSPNGAGQTTAKQYSAPGSYPVTLIVDVNGCSDRITKFVTQAPRAVPSFTVDLGECDNKNVKFTNTSTAPSFGNYSGVWKFGDNNSAAGLNVQHTYNNFNSYTATLVVRTDLGCVDSISNPVTLKESPKASFTIQGASCTNENVDFVNGTNVPAGSTNTYEWEFGDANGSTLDNPSHSYPSEGTYTITLKAMSTNGCESTEDRTVTIEEKPVADFTVNKVCKGEETVFTNNSTASNTGLTYQWDLGNSSTPTTKDVTVTYANAGSYNVEMIATSTNGCTDTAVKTAEVGEIPNVDIAVASNLTQDGTMRFSTSVTGVTYKWFFGDGSTSDQQNPVYKFNFATRYTVRLVVTNADGCSNSTSTEVSINPLSIGDINGVNWSIYPNPSNGNFFIKYEGTDIANLTVSDMLGKTITSVIPQFNNGVYALDLANQTAGMYIVTLTDVNGHTSTQKVTISK